MNGAQLPGYCMNNTYIILYTENNTKALDVKL
jgi:hypothetical protein